MNKAVQEIMDTYTPIEVKKLIQGQNEVDFVHHQEPKEIVRFYHDYFEDLHHWLLDDIHAFEYYSKCQAAYNYAQAECTSEENRFALQQEFIKDVVYIFIATVCWDLAASHDMLDMTMQEVEDYQLARDLEMRKSKLQVIDGGKS